MEKTLIGFFILLLSVCLASSSIDYVYHNYERLSSILKDYSVKYPTKTFLYSIGKSVEKRDLWVMAISANQPQTHLTLRPEVKVVGNLHGNTFPSGEVLLSFIDHLLVNPTADPSVDYILRNIRIHILVSINPDGVEQALNSFSPATSSCSTEIQIGRNNSNNYDLNRNFPDRAYCNRAARQPETEAIINWMEANTFVLSVKLMTGFIVAIYPWESFRMPKKVSPYSDVDIPTDYDDMFRYLASRYSLNHKAMINVTCEEKTFPEGITNGARGFYRIEGGMQDFNFFRYGCPELTIGVSCCMAPAESQLAELWKNNTKPLIELVKRGNTGIRGVIEFKNRGVASGVGVRFNARDPIFKTNSAGEYYVLLVPGVYNMSVMISCDQVLFSSQIEVPTRSRLIVLNITLSEKDYDKFYAAHVDRYPLFCNKSSAPVKCKSHNENDTSSSSEESDDEDANHDGNGNSAYDSRRLSNSELVFVTLAALMIYRCVRDF